MTSNGHTATLISVEHLSSWTVPKAALALTGTCVEIIGWPACDSAVTGTGATIELAWSETYAPLAFGDALTIQFILDTQPFYSNWIQTLEADDPHKS